MEEGCGPLPFTLFEEMHNSMPWWHSFHRKQVAFHSDQSISENFNNGFLIVYIWDLLSASLSDGNLLCKVATRMTAQAAALGHSVI